MSRWLPFVSLVLTACGSSEPPPESLEDIAARKCPRVHMDKMTGDWLLSTGNPKTRMRLVVEGDKTLLWYIDPSFSNHKLELVGTKRDKDWQFDELPRGARTKLVETGGEAKKRLYLQPKMTSCAVEVYAGTVNAEGKETMPPKAKEFLQWPDGSPQQFSFAPHDETLFLGEAATDKTKADKQLKDQGAPGIEVEMGSVVVGVWTDVSSDGDAACSYTYDAYFDDQLVEGATEQSAADVNGETRHWTHTFEAPYSGNHRFELHRFRQCDDGARERIAVAGTDAAMF